MQNNNQPVAWMYKKDEKTFYYDYRDASLVLQYGYKETPLYTHPHQWQGLTDDEIDKIYADTEPNSKMDTYYMVLSRAIEQELRNKNANNT